MVVLISDYIYLINMPVMSIFSFGLIPLYGNIFLYFKYCINIVYNELPIIVTHLCRDNINY